MLPVSQFVLHFHSWDQNKLPGYPGSAWRGAFGHALKKIVCVAKDTPCQSCPLHSACVYPYIFETPPPPGSAKMRRYQAAPHPFVLLPLGYLHDDPHNYQLRLTLIGNSQRYLPYLIQAFKIAGEHGIGGKRQIFQLRQISQTLPGGDRMIYQDETLETPSMPMRLTIPLCPQQLQITLLTPLRIKQQGHNSNNQRITFSALFGNLLRRISMLSYFHTDTPLETDFAGLTQAAAQIDINTQRLYWHDWTRYSSRQKTTMQMGGLLGSIELEGDKLEPFWPYLWLGQWVHAGKGTSMGLGAYHIEAASLPALPGN